MSVFETLRERVAVEEIVASNSEVRGGTARCVAPDHRDARPSMRLYEDHVHCFSCGFHGDAVDVWAAIRGFHSPIEAALDLAREHGIELPPMDPDAERRDEERREKEAACMREALACHGDLVRHRHVREWWRSRGFDEQLQERYLLGASADGRAATIPYWHRGRVQAIIRRNLEGHPKYVLPDSEDLPYGHKALFVPGRLGTDTYVVEGFIDGLALHAMGETVVATGGTQPNEAQLRALTRLPGELYILFDADEAGYKAAMTLARQLYPKARVCPASYGEGLSDPADLFAAKGEDALETLEEVKRASEDLIDIEADVAGGLGDHRRALDYAVESIIPLACELNSDIAQEAALDLAAERLKGVRPAWLKKALKAQKERREAEQSKGETRAQAESVARARKEYLDSVEAATGEIAEIFARPGVLDRFCEDAAEMHGVIGDEYAIKLVTLVALGAQLEPLPNGRPLGPSILLTAPPGRGKNYIVDATVRLIPDEFYNAFEIASAQAFYYAVENDPGFLRHTFVYPNEIEAVDTLVGFLRPILSSGKAVKFTVNKDENGSNVVQELKVEGPITTAIPTTRNKIDDQLQSRLLVSELTDYPGRVKRHSAAFSALLLPEYTANDSSRRVFLWRAGLRQLAGRRRVVFPIRHSDFALDNDDLLHGARTWANLLGLMCAHAWLEQYNRKRMELPTKEEAIVAEPADYQAAYEIFKASCTRTVFNLSDAHRKVLEAVHALGEEDPSRDGFPQRRVAQKAGVSQSTVSSNKTFLVQSAKLLVETEEGLALVAGAEPSWWTTGDVMSGIPTPEEVEEWWECSPTPSMGASGIDHADHHSDAPLLRHDDAENGDRHLVDQRPIGDRSFEMTPMPPDGGNHDRQVISGMPFGVNGSTKENIDDLKGSD